MLLLSGRKAWGSRGPRAALGLRVAGLSRCPSPCPVPPQVSFNAVLGPEMEFSPREANLSQASGVMARVVAPKVPERAGCRPALPFRFPYRPVTSSAPSCTPGAPGEPCVGCLSGSCCCCHFSRPLEPCPAPNTTPRSRWGSF